VIRVSIPSEDVLLNSLNHQIRRDVLELLNSGKKTYSQLLNNFVIPTGKLNYHLRLLEGLIVKDLDGLYELTPLGMKAIKILTQFRTEITDTEKPLIRQAYITQQNEQESFLHLMFISRMNFKFYMLIITGLFLVAVGIYFLSIGGASFYVISTVTLGIIVMAGGIHWILKIKRAAPEFITQMDRLLKSKDREEK
jgi:heme exporter protein D